MKGYIKQYQVLARYETNYYVNMSIYIVFNCTFVLLWLSLALTDTFIVVLRSHFQTRRL